MKEIQLITKENCSRCSTLKNWLKIRNIDYEELNIEDEMVKKILLKDGNFISNFCDDMGCIIITPILRIKETGKYYGKRLFGIDGIRSQFVEELLDIKN